jgi:hypothetical protein
MDFAGAFGDIIGAGSPNGNKSGARNQQHG